jgi:two-component system OmpR family response regulator/two-component system response regulator QseB
MRILLAEDDPLLGRGIVDALTRAAFSVDWVEDGVLALEAAKAAEFDMIVLDLGLPRLDGLEVLRQLRRSKSRTPVLILTARDRVSDRISGLDAGADDYLGKPFDLQEMIARLRALHRRARGEASSVLEHQELRMDPAALLVTWQGRPLELPRREFGLLRLLLENQGRVMTHEAIIEKLYNWADEADSTTLAVHIHALRRKLAPELIRTVRGIGYVIDKVSGDKLSGDKQIADKPGEADQGG